jgi:hypothetical protein
VFPLHCSVSSVCHFSVFDVRLVVGVNALQYPSVVITLSYLLEVTSNCVCSDYTNGEHVAVVHQQEASSEVGPGERHFYN